MTDEDRKTFADYCLRYTALAEHEKQIDAELARWKNMEQDCREIAHTLRSLADIMDAVQEGLRDLAVKIEELSKSDTATEVTGDD